MGNRGGIILVIEREGRSFRPWSVLVEENIKLAPAGAAYVVCSIGCGGVLTRCETISPTPLFYAEGVQK